MKGHVEGIDFSPQFFFRNMISIKYYTKQIILVIIGIGLLKKRVHLKHEASVPSTTKEISNTELILEMPVLSHFHLRVPYSRNLE